ncbi:OmpH family outer membrane protein [Comamonas nitrativorans]|uniref:OmpH family outer membrane protein n=1 Tax=Comamonas nitrativorans TaxID=108437 RepID=A0ABV9GZS1_9BURK
MKKFTRTIVAASLLAGLSFSAFADFKAGFVNTDRVFREANAAKAAQTKLEQEFSKREKELITLRDGLKRSSDAFERDAPTMSESQRIAKQRDLVDQDREFQRKSREFQEDLGNRKNEELARVLDQANKVVQQVAEAEQYDVILQEAVYVNPKHDITDKVIKALNAAK